MKIVSVLLCACLCLILVGCGSSPMLSMNKRMAYADSGATLVAAVAIDQVTTDKFDATKAEVIQVCEQLKKFLDDGLVVDLPVNVAKQKIEEFLISKGWGAYIGLVEVSFAWIDMQVLPVDKLGPNNVAVIKAGLDGIIRQATRAKKEWAQPFGTATVDTTKGKSLTFKK